MTDIEPNAFGIAKGAAAHRHADRPIVLRIDDPDRRLGRTPTILLHRSGRIPAILRRSLLVDGKGKGRFFGWMPVGLEAIEVRASADAATTGRPPGFRVYSPSHAEIAVRIGLSAPFAAWQTLRLAFARNSKGFRYRFVRLFEALSAPRYGDWSKAQDRGIALSKPTETGSAVVFITVLGEGKDAAESRRSLARQTLAVREISLEDLQARLPEADEAMFWMVLAAGATLEDTAIERMARPLLADGSLSGAYGDEDRQGARDPFFKPAWNAPLSETGWLPQDGALVRLKALPEGFKVSDDTIHTLLSAVAAAGDIVHVPRVLLHRRHPRAAARSSQPRPVGGPARVSVVIPTRDRADLLRTCLDGLLNRTRAGDLDVIVIDNESREPETLALFRDYERDGRIRRLPLPGPFNFSRACNIGAAAARHDLLLLLNNDIDPIEPGWLEQMAAEMDDSRIGATGALLLFPDGSIQHAGVTLGAGSVARHSFHFRYPDAGEDLGLVGQRQEMSAVTAACLLTRRSLWEAVGGMDETRLTVAFNDVDYCLKLRERGYGILWTPHARLIHHESVSRGSDDTPEKIARFAQEERYMHERWGSALASDPFYNPNLSLAAGDWVLEAAPRDLSPRLARLTPAAKRSSDT